MYIHRLEQDLLLHWLNKKGRKPLVMRGTRQVGKSSLVRESPCRGPVAPYKQM